MKLIKILSVVLLLSVINSCALEEADIKIQSEDFPFRLQIDEEGADLADAEDYGIEISFADYLEDLPTSAITLTYELEGEGDFADVSIDEILYEYEDDDCVFEREVSFTANSITIPVDTDLGTVPESFEIIVAFNLPVPEATEGGFKLTITDVQSSDNVVFNQANEFEYEVLDNEAAGDWELELDETQFEEFKDVLSPISPDLSELAFEDFSGKVSFSFEFEEMKIEIELNEEEEVEECVNGEVETDTENLVIELEAEYEAEDGELVFEGSYINEDGEELDFILEAEFEFDSEGNIIITLLKLIDEDQFEEGDELFLGEATFTLVKD